MFKKLLFTTLLMQLSLLGFSQVTPKTKPVVIDDPLSTVAFDSLVNGNINFMVIGDDNIKQGVSYEYKEDNTELALSGVLSNKGSSIVTIDGKFAIQNGAFIFDENDGSKKGKLNLNLFLTYPNFNYKWYRVHEVETQNAMILNDFERKAIANKTYDTIMTYQAIFKLLKIEQKSVEDSIFSEERKLLNKVTDNKFDFNLDNYIATNESKIITKLKTYYSKLESATIPALKIEIEKLPKEEKIIVLKNKDLIKQSYIKELKYVKLFKEYDKAFNTFKAYISENNKTEINNFKKHWTLEGTNYFGITAFYERQGFDIYNPNALSTVSFSDRFKEIRSDLYGLSGSLNYIFTRQNKSYLILRVLQSLGRSNNFDDYKKKDYSFTSSSQDVNGIPIESTESKTGYVNGENQDYKYGTFSQTGFEIYASLPVAGIFARINYRNNDALENRETYPLETGILINLKSKDKKNIIAIQLFMSRMNLKTHPDDDMNFGLKLGLPINLPKG